MDDVQRVEKINAMSQELKKFGFSDNTMDAIEGAKEILMTEEDQQESRVFTSEEEVVVELSNSFKRFKEMTTAKMQEMTRNIVNLHGQIDELNSNIAALQSRNEPSPPESPSPTISPQEEPQSQESVKQEDLPSAKPEGQEEKPAKHESQERKEEKPYYEKQGHFTSDDVRIEDIFYYGNK
ncbi:hypothetical protein HQ533_03270 [Candidatus Woesearchaeota archaeon]|nr:hypothetical protein [Candidatus Woesearchaeota archaeon]